MRKQTLLLLFTTIASMAMTGCNITVSSSSNTSETPSQSSEPASSKETSEKTSESTSTQTLSSSIETTSLTSEATSSQISSQEISSEQTSSTTSAAAFDVDYVKLFVSRTGNLKNYTHVYAWKDNTKITGSWPGTKLEEYDNNWLVYDFSKLYSTFSIVLNIGSDKGKTSDITIRDGVGAYWFYNDELTKSNEMPDFDPSSSSSSMDPSSSSSQSGSSSEPAIDEIEGNIFHAFNWSLNTIKDNLQAIKDAGYTAIQTSPIQRPKDYSDQWKKNNDWWKLYQPFSFDVPADGTWMGTPTDLRNLTNAAHKAGLKIIVDVVANHMGGEGDTISSAIENYEPEIYRDRSNTVRSNGACTNWNNRWDVTHRRMGGYPDLNTGSSKVQSAVYDYLVQLIDNGVDGFRFDAAKHIETPFDDNKTKSDFWTNTAGKAELYAATTLDKDIFMYGEILNETPQIPFNYYTTHDDEKLLDAVTDNKTGNNILSAIESGNSVNAAKSAYSSGLPAQETVIWGESHDTYLNGDGTSKDSSQEDVDKAYVLVGSRKGTHALYFARPNMNADIGSGSTQTESYKSSLITAVNKLKIDMDNNDEALGYKGNIAYVTRYGANGYGAAIVNVSGSGQATLAFSNLKDGTYKDLITGATYVMSNHSITVNISSYGATVIERIA